MFSGREMASAEMDRNDVNFQYGDNYIKVEIKSEPDEYNFELQSRDVLEDSADKPSEPPKKTIICNEEEFRQDFGGVVKSEIEFGEWEIDGVIKSEVMHKQNELEQSNETLDTDEILMNGDKRGQSEENKRVNGGKKPIKCDGRVKTFSLQSSRKKYNRVRNTRKELFKCDICDKEFLYKSVLRIHMRKHSKEKPFKCNVCEKTFTRNSLLQGHKRKHTGERPFKCDDCNKTFLQQLYLQTHKRKHTEEMPYKCDDCDKTFPHRSNLRVHKRKHTGERPFKCDDCDKTFTRKPNLLAHKRIHTKEKPLKCNNCDQTFAWHTSLKRHQQKIHKII